MQPLFFNLRFRPHFLHYHLQNHIFRHRGLQNSSSISFFREDLETFATTFDLLECIRRSLRQGGNADRSMTLFSFACFF